MTVHRDPMSHINTYSRDWQAIKAWAEARRQERAIRARGCDE